jgi:monoamine oxidase
VYYLSASKIFLQAKKRFWANEGLSGFATTDLPVREVSDTTYRQPGTRGILQAHPISLHSRRVTAMSERERINFALEQMDKVYPGMRTHFESA